MLYNYNGTKVYYKFFDRQSKRVTLLLHGWGRTGDDFETIISQFPERSFLVIDFPPFGKSDKIVVGWGIFTYAQMVMSLCEHLKLSQVDIVGHSFGGRIAIIISALEGAYVHSCILVDSAGMKPRRSLKYHYKVIKYKMCKKLGKNIDNYGSKDYQSLSPDMKNVFSNVVQTHLEDYARTISSATLIIWGEKDQETPVYMAKRLNKLIKNSQLKVLESGHFSFLDCPFEFYTIVKQFWEEI